MSDADLASRFPQLRPVASPPSLESVAGTGFGLLGRRDHDPATDSVVKTRVLRLLFVPLAALDAYRVSAAPEGGWYVLGREPLSGAARVWNTLLVLVLLGIGGLVANHFLSGSPGARALARLDRADRHLAAGEVEEAARLYDEVARGGTEHAAAAEQKFGDLLGEPLDEAPLSAAAGVLRVGADWAEFQALVLPRGLELVDRRGADDSDGALAVLEVVEPLAEDVKAFDARVRPLLEAWVKQHKEDAGLATALARVYERGGQADRAAELLTPHRDRLGSGEGARILGQRLARKGELDLALPLLEAYVRDAQPRIEAAERHFERSFERLRRSIRERVEHGRAEGFPYQEFEKAGPAEQERIYTEYETAQLRDNPERRRASERLGRLNTAVLAVLDLGAVYLKRARQMGDPAAGKAEFEKARQTFLAAGHNAGKQPALFCAQLAYWMGDPAEGKKQFDKVIAEEKRRPDLLIAVSELLREVGVRSDARTLAEEAFDRATEEGVKKQAALARALVARDRADEVRWLEKADTAQPSVRALLAGARGRLARQQGDDEAAARHHREALELLAALPESDTTLNDRAAVCLELYDVTGDAAELVRARRLLEQAAALRPGDRLLLHSRAASAVEAGYRDLAAGTLDLGALRLRGLALDLDHLYDDRAGRDALHARARRHPDLKQGVDLAEELRRRAPRQAMAYAHLVDLYAWSREAEALRRLEGQLDEVELDGTGPFQQPPVDHDEQRKELAFEAARREKRLAAVEKKGGPTAVLAAVSLARQLRQGDRVGEAVDAGRVVRLAEQAHAAAPSRATRAELVHSLLFRAHRDLAQRQPAYAELARRFRGILDPVYLVAVALEKGGPLREGVRAHQDVRAACELLRQSSAAFADEPSPWAYVLLEATHPEDAARVAEAFRKDEVGQRARSLRARTAPLNLMVVLEQAWALRLLGREAEAKSLLKRCADAGVPTPFDVK